MKNNKKLLLLPLAMFVLSACGGGDSETEDRGDSDVPGQVSQPSLTPPSNLGGSNPILDRENDTFTLRFSTRENKNNNFYISTRSDNPIRNIEFKKEHEDQLSDYIYNYELFSQNLERLGGELLNTGEAQIQFSIDDLPADMYQNIEQMDADRIIKDILKINLMVDNGVRLSRDIAFNYKNENTVLRLPEFFDGAFTFNQSSTNFISIPIIDPNVNDRITYSVKGQNRLESISLYTEQECEKVSDYELINCVVSGNVDERGAMFSVNAESITDPTVVETLVFTVTDQSRNINVTETEGDENTTPSSETSFGGLNVITEMLDITILNSDDDLTPTVNFSGSSHTISERNGGYVSFTVNPANDRPDADLRIDYQITLDGLSISSELDTDNNRVVFSNLDISEDVERVLRVTASDGQYSGYNETLVRFTDDVDKSPSLTVPSSITINESTGGKISYNASMFDGSLVNVQGSFVNGFNAPFHHNSYDSEFVFENLALSENQIGIFRITVSNSIESVSRDIQVSFNSDINPIIDFPSEISVLEDGSGNMFSYNARIENNTQNRNMTLDFELNTPTGVNLSILEEESVIFFDTEELRIRGDLTRQMNIIVSDGVSTIVKEVIVTFVNNIDKELEEFLEGYEPVKRNMSQLIGINADMVILDFYTQIARMRGVKSSIIEKHISDAKEINEYEIDFIRGIENEIDSILSEITITTPNPDFDYLKLRKNELEEAGKNFGHYIVTNHINNIAKLEEFEGMVLSEFDSIGDNTFNITGVYGRYIGNMNYGTIITGNRFETRDNFKFIDLVNPNKNRCNTTTPL